MPLVGATSVITFVGGGTATSTTNFEGFHCFVAGSTPVSYSVSKTGFVTKTGSVTGDGSYTVQLDPADGYECGPLSPDPSPVMGIMALSLAEPEVMVEHLTPHVRALAAVPQCCCPFEVCVAVLAWCDHTPIVGATVTLIDVDGVTVIGTQTQGAYGPPCWSVLNKGIYSVSVSADGWNPFSGALFPNSDCVDHTFSITLSYPDHIANCCCDFTDVFAICSFRRCSQKGIPITLMGNDGFGDFEMVAVGGGDWTATVNRPGAPLFGGVKEEGGEICCDTSLATFGDATVQFIMFCDEVGGITTSVTWGCCNDCDTIPNSFGLIPGLGDPRIPSQCQTGGSVGPGVFGCDPVNLTFTINCSDSSLGLIYGATLTLTVMG